MTRREFIERIEAIINVEYNSRTNGNLESKAHIVDVAVRNLVDVYNSCANDIIDYESIVCYLNVDSAVNYTKMMMSLSYLQCHRNKLISNYIDNANSIIERKYEEFNISGYFQNQMLCAKECIDIINTIASDLHDIGYDLKPCDLNKYYLYRILENFYNKNRSN